MRKPVHPGLQRGRRHVRPDSPQLAGFRLFVCAFGLSLAVFSALNPPEVRYTLDSSPSLPRIYSGADRLEILRPGAQNLFLSLSTPHSTLSRLFPFLRHPLDIRLATETLARAWSHTLLHHRPLDEPELALLNRLQSLDARLVYIAYGAKPLMQCEWCRPPGGGNMSSLGGTIIGLDYLLASAPTILIAYLTTLAACGFLLSGNGRQRWRIWIVIPIVGGLGAEAYMRLTWDGGRGQAASGASISMVRSLLSLSLCAVSELTARAPNQIHSQLHVLRSLFFASLLTISYLAPASFHPIPALLQPDTSTIVAPALAAITNQGEDALQRLRALSIARMAVLHEDRSRKEVRCAPASCYLLSLSFSLFCVSPPCLLGRRACPLCAGYLFLLKLCARRR
jgi:hypothetical protein